MAVAGGDNVGKIFVSFLVFDQQNGASSIGYEFTPDNGFNTHFLGCLNKKDKSIQSIGIGQGQPLQSHILCSLADLLNGADSPTPGEMGVDVEMDETAHSS